MRLRQTEPSAAPKKGWVGDVLSPETKQKCHDYRHHAAQGVNAAASVALLVGGLSQGNADNARTGLIRTVTQAAWFARVSEKVAFLKRFETTRMILGISTAGMALRAPQLIRVFENGSALSRSLAVLVTSAFALQVAPPLEQMIRRHGRSLWDRITHLRYGRCNIVNSISAVFQHAADRIDRCIYNNPVASKVLACAPKVFMEINAAGTIVNGCLRDDWYAVAAGATYLAGAGLVYVAEKYIGNPQPPANPVGVYDPPASADHHPAVVDPGNHLIIDHH